MSDFDPPGRLARLTREAIAHRTALDRSGRPVPTSEREAAQAAVDAARAAERAYWSTV